MIPIEFRHHRPTDAAQAAGLLAADPGGSRVLAGGTWVVPEMSRGESSPRALVDLRDAGLDEIAATEDGVSIGAMCTYSDVLGSALVRELAPLLMLAAAGITGGWSLRNQATVIGALAAARPSSDAPGVLVAARARAVVLGPGGVRRRVGVDELIAGPMRVALGEGEFVIAVEIPRLPRHVGYYKLKRGYSSWPIVTASAIVHGVGETCDQVRVVLGGAAGRPIVVDLPGGLAGATVDESTLRFVAQRAADAVSDPWDDALAPGDYRAAVAGPVARRALKMAFDSMTGGT